MHNKIPYIAFLPNATNIQRNRFKNQISVNIISQIYENMIGEYSLGYYPARHAVNSVGF